MKLSKFNGNNNNGSGSNISSMFHSSPDEKIKKEFSKFSQLYEIKKILKNPKKFSCYCKRNK